ncbi:MAG: hypothetical protein ACP5I4_14060 [Oceanipulchritudo sp.]
MNTSKHIISGMVICLLAAVLMIPHTLEANVRFGPYEALSINSDVIRGVKVEENGRIWILLNPAYRERELIVKISNREGSDYRKWYTSGTEELVSPANQGKQANAWTDWIETEAGYIEYWMNGQLVLHLVKVE